MRCRNRKVMSSVDSSSAHSFSWCLILNTRLKTPWNIALSCSGSMTLVNHWWTLHPNNSIRQVGGSQVGLHGNLFPICEWIQNFAMWYLAVSQGWTLVWWWQRLVCIHGSSRMGQRERSDKPRSLESMLLKILRLSAVNQPLLFFILPTVWAQPNSWSRGAWIAGFTYIQFLLRRELAQEWGIRIAFDTYLSLMKQLRQKNPNGRLIPKPR